MKDRVLILAATIFASTQMVNPLLAQEAKDSKAPSEPTAADVQNSKDRGIYIAPIRARGTKTDKPATTTKAPEHQEKAPVKTKVEEKAVEKKAEKTEKKTETAPAKTTAKTHAPEKTEKAHVNAKPEKSAKKTPVTAKTESKPAAKKHHSVTHEQATAPAPETAKTVVTPKTETVKYEPKTVHSATPSSAGEQIVTAWLNKEGQTPHYKDGERLKVSVSAHKDCNVLIFNYDGEMLTQIFPNKFQTDSIVKAGQTVEIGGNENAFDFQVSNAGKDPSKEKIFVYAYPIEQKNDAPLSVALNTLPASPFRSTEYSPEQYRKLVSESKVFFSRSVKVVPKRNVTPVSYATEELHAAPNKIELSLVVDAN